MLHHRLRTVTVPLAAGDGYSVIVASGKVDEDLVDYPLMVRLQDFPQSLWDDLNPDGSNLRAYGPDGVTPLPIDVTYVNPQTKVGRMFVKTTLTAATNTTVIIKTLDSSTTSLPVTDPNGRNAVWSDYEVVWQFPETVNRTGNAYSQVDNTELFSIWKKQQDHSFVGAPHQGLAVDPTGNVVTIDTNYLRKHTTSDLDTVVASNSDPCGDIRAATGSLVSHLCDGQIINGEFWSICNNYPSQSNYEEYLVVFNLADLILNRTYDTSGLAGEELSGLCYNPVDGKLYGCNYDNGTHIHVFTTSGGYEESIALSTPIPGAQGIEYIDGKLYISSGSSTNYIREVELDGTVNRIIYSRPADGVSEGISYDGTSLWVLNGDGDVERLERDPGLEDWARLHLYSNYAVIPAPSTVFTMSALVKWLHPLGDLQQAFLSYANGSDPNNRATLAYDEGPDKIGLWNRTDKWMYSSLNPDAYEIFSVGAYHNGTVERALFVNGNRESTDVGCAERPYGTDAEFLINSRDTSNGETGMGYYQNVWLRNEAMSDAWMAADTANNISPLAFYSISAL